MGFNLTDLVIESILVEGFTAIRREPKILEDVFSKLNEISPIINKKFGDREIARIKKYFQEKEIPIVQAFPTGPADIPCISIQLIDSTENGRYAHLDDYVTTVSEALDDEELAAKVKASDLGVLDFDPLSGTLEFDPSDNIDNVNIGNMFVDAAGNKFKVVGGIINTTSRKQFMIAPNSAPDTLGPCSVVSQITTKTSELRGNMEDEKLLLGVHTEERLLTAYLMVLVKYFIVSRKKDLINRGFQLSTYSVSDFNLKNDYRADLVYSRYLTLSGTVENEWKSDVISAIEDIEVQVLVDKDVYGNKELDLTDQTVKLDDGEE